MCAEHPADIRILAQNVCNYETISSFILNNHCLVTRERSDALLSWYFQQEEQEIVW